MTAKRFACPTCGEMPILTDGSRIYARRPDLHDKPMWQCKACPDTYVGCHPGTTDPLGFPAYPDLRRARSLLHDQRLDPLWKNAPDTGGYSIVGDDERKLIQRLARGRVYGFLASRLGIERDDCHTAQFDIETCRRAWRELSATTYPEIREWAQTGKLAREKIKAERKERKAKGKTKEQTDA